MATANVAKLRYDAEHCRRLARSFNDVQCADALRRTAAEFDDEADKLEKDAAEEA
jgi:hypothetical protein